MGFQTKTSHVPPVLTLALFSIRRARCALLGSPALALPSAMAVVVIAGQRSGMEQTGNAAALQLALEPISSDKCNKATLVSEDCLVHRLNKEHQLIIRNNATQKLMSGI